MRIKLRFEKPNANPKEKGGNTYLVAAAEGSDDVMPQEDPPGSPPRWFPVSHLWAAPYQCRCSLVLVVIVFHNRL
jgi:hypothetical protein